MARHAVQKNACQHVDSSQPPPGRQRRTGPQKRLRPAETDSASFTRAAGQAFEALRERVHRVARAWEVKETAMAIFELKASWAARWNFAHWFAWAIRSQLGPIKRVARTLQRCWDQIENYFRHRITNAGLEAINTKIQGVKRRSRGFRSRERFKMAIYFHCGGLDLYPAGAALRP